MNEGLVKDALESFPRGTLSRMAVSGGLGTTLNTLITKILGGVKTVILARLLSPADFGLIGLALVIVRTVNRFSYPGLYTALIQKEELEREDLEAGWWIHALRGASLFLLAFLLAGTIAEFYEEQRLKLVLQLVSLTFLLEGLKSIGLVRLNRTLDFRRLTWINQVANVAGLVVGVVLAWRWQNVWALVAAHIVQLAVSTVMSYLIEPFFPRLKLNWSRAKQLMHFGKYIFVAGTFYIVILRGNEFVLGKVVGVEVYGYYALALSLVAMVSTPSVEAVTRVAFPAMSRLQADRERLQSAYLRVFRTTVLLTTPALLGLAIFGRDIIVLILGAKWMPMLSSLIWLCMFHWFHGLGLTLQSLYTAIGEVAWTAKLRFAQMVLYLVGIIPLATHYGPAGAAFWLFIVAAAAFFVHLVGTSRHCSGLSSKMTRVVVSYWPLFVVQAGVAMLHMRLPSRWLTMLTLGGFYLLFAAAFGLWKEKDLIMDLVKNMQKGKGSRL